MITDVRACSASDPPSLAIRQEPNISRLRRSPDSYQRPKLPSRIIWYRSVATRCTLGSSAPVAAVDADRSNDPSSKALPPTEAPLQHQPHRSDRSKPFSSFTAYQREVEKAGALRDWD
jgi:hypothetical protein